MKEAKRLSHKWLVVFSVIFCFSSCDTVPITNRQRVNLVPDSVINSMSFSSYQDVISKSKLSTDKRLTAKVRRVGERIQQAVEQYFRSEGRQDVLRGYKWEYNLIEDDAVNAWAMPGGKVAVYTGLLKVARTDEDLAVVMGHEIAHAVAEHGSERLTLQWIAAGVGWGVEKMTEEQEAQRRAIFLGLYGLGVQYGALLPYSRTHESEADQLGLIFMALAGYDPHEAIPFWEDMAKQSKGDAPPELLSTHPSHETRIRRIREQYLPQAMIYYTGDLR